MDVCPFTSSIYIENANASIIDYCHIMVMSAKHLELCTNFRVSCELDSHSDTTVGTLDGWRDIAGGCVAMRTQRLTCMPTITVPFQIPFTSKFLKHSLIYICDFMTERQRRRRLRQHQHIRWFYSQTHPFSYCFRKSTIASSVVRWQMPLYHVDGRRVPSSGFHTFA